MRNSCFQLYSVYGNFFKIQNKIQQKSLQELSPGVRINELKDAYHAVMVCLREMEKIKTFLEDKKSWWKILQAHSADCCQQKLPHLHGFLNESLVTLMLEEDIDEVQFLLKFTISFKFYEFKMRQSLLFDNERKNTCKQFISFSSLHIMLRC